MIMKFEENNSAEDEFSALFEFEDKKDLIDHKAHMIMFRCLSEIEKITGGNLSKKELSNLVETSPSYITQLFRGDKLLNLLMLAKFELALDSEFDITLRKISSEKKTENEIVISKNANPISFEIQRRLTIVHLNIDSKKPLEIDKNNNYTVQAC